MNFIARDSATIDDQTNCCLEDTPAAILYSIAIVGCNYVYVNRNSWLWQAWQ